jgi:hypothetical protein
VTPVSTRDNQGRAAHTPGFPLKFVGVDELHAAFINESRTRGSCLVPRTGNPGISLVFREMRRMNQESEGKSSGIPHLAKNERDVGHPSWVWEQGSMRGGEQGSECTSHLRYKTDHRHPLQRRGTLMVPRLWSYAR